MDRSVRTNPKYDKIKSSIDTGASVNRVSHITQGQYLRRQSEIFFRLSAHDLYARSHSGMERSANTTRRSFPALVWGVLLP